MSPRIARDPMTKEQRDLIRLLVEVSRHYAGRRFERHTIGLLRATIIGGTKGGTFSVHNTMHNFECAIADLLCHFTAPSATASETELHAADAIFAFSCGYQLAHLEEPKPKNRRPGKNNTRLAEIAALLAQKHRKPLFVQFEIAAVPALSSFEKYESTKEDLGTKDVISQFMAIAESHKVKPVSVIVVAHGHHIERCIRLLDKYFSVKGLRSGAAPYYEYDPDECQPRAMSAEDYIVSDFISMAAMTKDVLVERAIRCKQ